MGSHRKIPVSMNSTKLFWMQSQKPFRIQCTSWVLWQCQWWHNFIATHSYREEAALNLLSPNPPLVMIDLDVPRGKKKVIRRMVKMHKSATLQQFREEKWYLLVKEVARADDRGRRSENIIIPAPGNLSNNLTAKNIHTWLISLTTWKAFHKRAKKCTSERKRAFIWRKKQKQQQLQTKEQWIWSTKWTKKDSFLFLVFLSSVHPLISKFILSKSQSFCLGHRVQRKRLNYILKCFVCFKSRVPGRRKRIELKWGDRQTEGNWHLFRCSLQQKVILLSTTSKGAADCPLQSRKQVI